MSSREARIGSENPDQSVNSPDNPLARLTRFGLGDILSLIEDGWKLDTPGSIDSDYNPALRVIDPSDKTTFVRLTRNKGDGAESVVMTFTEGGEGGGVFICGRKLTFGAKLLQTDDPGVNAVQQAFVKKGLLAAVEDPLSHAAVEHKRSVDKVYLWGKKGL